MLQRETPLPLVKRPFPEEPLGGWLGRVAGFYKMDIDELAANFGLDLGFDDECRDWRPKLEGAEARLSVLPEVPVRESGTCGYPGRRVGPGSRRIGPSGQPGGQFQIGHASGAHQVVQRDLKPALRPQQRDFIAECDVRHRRHVEDRMLGMPHAQDRHASAAQQCRSWA